MIRRFQILSARATAFRSSSRCVTPTKTHNPDPIVPTTSSSTVTRASLTRCTTARTDAAAYGRPLAGLGRRGGRASLAHGCAEVQQLRS
jgi:hypothetical protein